jgi:hypothetical protein
MRFILTHYQYRKGLKIFYAYSDIFFERWFSYGFTPTN